MINKISKISDNLYQLNGEETPIDETTLNGLLSESALLGVEDADKWHKELDKNGSAEFEDKIVTGNKGTIVNIYEVEYPAPANPNDETQEMSKHLDEYKDFVTQNLFPGVGVEDILVTTQTEEQKEQAKRKQFKESELQNWYRKFHKRGWREVLND